MLHEINLQLLSAGRRRIPVTFAATLMSFSNLQREIVLYTKTVSGDAESQKAVNTYRLPHPWTLQDVNYKLM